MSPHAHSPDDREVTVGSIFEPEILEIINKSWHCQKSSPGFSSP